MEREGERERGSQRTGIENAAAVGIWDAVHLSLPDSATSATKLRKYVSADWISS